MIVSHCILNQNAVIRGWERAIGAYGEIVRILLDRQLGIIQLPCPEFTYQGEARPSRSKQEYDTREYRVHCKELAEGTAAQLKEYLTHGYQIVGLIGIGESPTCDTKLEKGNLTPFTNEILAQEGKGVDEKAANVLMDYVNWFNTK
jgi:predicted secreted protein